MASQFASVKNKEIVQINDEEVRENTKKAPDFHCLSHGVPTQTVCLFMFEI